MSYAATRNRQNPSQKRRPLPKGILYRFVLALLAISLALNACANAATPEKPIYPTAPATQTIEQPSPTMEAPTQEPTAEPTAEPTLSPAERNYEWTAEEAVTVRADLTERELNELLENLPIFPLVYTESEGIYAQSCVLESISFLQEGHYISVGGFNVRVTGQCSYLDTNNEKQTITVALVVENAIERTTWMPFLTEILSGKVSPSFIQEFFTTTTGIEPGRRITVSFNLPNPANQAEYREARHHGEMVSQLYTEEEIEMYQNTGDPAQLNHLLVPINVAGGRN